MTDEEKKAAAAAERASIKVDNLVKADEDKESQKADAGGTATEKAEANEETAVEETENKEEQVEASEKTEEELEAEKAEAKSAKEKERIQKRIDKEVAKRKTLEKEIEDLKKIIAEKSSEDSEKLTKAEAEKFANDLAEQKANERDFVNACNRLADAAKKLDKDFDKKIQQLSEDVAPLPGYMIGILDDLDNGGALLKYFTDNPDEYEELIALPATKMSIKLTKLSATLEAEAKKPVVPPKKQSKVPPPIDPVGGKGGGNTMVLTEGDTKDMATFIKKRQAMIEQRRKAGHYNAR